MELTDGSLAAAKLRTRQQSHVAAVHALPSLPAAIRKNRHQKAAFESSMTATSLSRPAASLPRLTPRLNRPYRCASAARKMAVVTRGCGSSLNMLVIGMHGMALGTCGRLSTK